MSALHVWQRHSLTRHEGQRLEAGSPVAGVHTRRMTTLSTRPVSLRPSGLAESPLLLIGLAVRLCVVELAIEVLEKLGFRILGIMRTMVTRTRSRGSRAFY